MSLDSMRVLIALSFLPEKNSKTSCQGFCLLLHEAGAEPDGASGAPSDSDSVLLS